MVESLKPRIIKRRNPFTGKPREVAEVAIGTAVRLTSDELTEVGLGTVIKGTETASEATKQALRGRPAIINRRPPQ